MPTTRRNRNPHVTESSEYNRGQREARRMFREAPTPTKADLAYFMRQIRVSARHANSAHVTDLMRAFHRGFEDESRSQLEGLEIWQEWEAERRQNVNAASIADGGWVVYPSEY